MKKVIYKNNLLLIKYGMPIMFFTGLLISCSCGAQKERTAYFPKVEVIPDELPRKENFWIFLMAGQSNMAGRGFVEPQDTVPNPRVLTINKDNKWILAKEPIHFYQPELSGLDCGLEFGKTLAENLGDSIYIGLIPCAVGGSSVSQWLNDSLFNNVQLYSNFKEKADLANTFGTVKGIIWHQGETNAMKNTVGNYERDLVQLFKNFRNDVGNSSLPIIAGELGPYTRDEAYGANRDKINSILHHIAESDTNTYVVYTGDLKPKENDPDHFSAGAQRKLGYRYANKIFNEISFLNF